MNSQILYFVQFIISAAVVTVSICIYSRAWFSCGTYVPTESILGLTISMGGIQM